MQTFFFSWCVFTLIWLTVYMLLNWLHGASDHQFECCQIRIRATLYMRMKTACESDICQRVCSGRSPGTASCASLELYVAAADSTRARLCLFSLKMQIVFFSLFQLAQSWQSFWWTHSIFCRISKCLEKKKNLSIPHWGKVDFVSVHQIIFFMLLQRLSCTKEISLLKNLMTWFYLGNKYLCSCSAI